MISILKKRLRSALDARGFHWQNLSDGDIKRRGWIHGRAWLSLTKRGLEYSGPRLQVEWSHGRAALDAEINLDRDEGRVCFHVAIPGASYYFIVEELPRSALDWLPFDARRTEYNYMGSHRSIGFRTHSGALWLSLWEDRHEWRHNDPWWWRARIGLDDIADLVFGKQVYSSETIEERDIEIPMYEGSTPARAKRDIAKWTRPRWPWAPFSKQRVGVHIDIPGGIETNHKGPLYGMSTPASTIAEGIGKVVASVLRDRGRYVAHSTERADG